MKKQDLCDFNCCMIVVAGRAGLSVSESADLLGSSHTQSLETQASVGKHTTPSAVNGNALLMRGIRGKWQDWFELPGRVQ